MATHSGPDARPVNHASQPPSEMGLFLLQMRKLELREVKSLAQVHNSSEKGWSWTQESKEGGNSLGHGVGGLGALGLSKRRKVGVLCDAPQWRGVQGRGMGELGGVGGAKTQKTLNARTRHFPCRARASGQSAGPPPGAHERVKITLQDQPLLVR